jgi:hypothetical protein
MPSVLRPRPAAWRSQCGGWRSEWPWRSGTHRKGEVGANETIQRPQECDHTEYQRAVAAQGERIVQVVPTTPL